MSNRRFIKKACIIIPLGVFLFVISSLFTNLLLRIQRTFGIPIWLKINLYLSPIFFLLITIFLISRLCHGHWRTYGFTMPVSFEYRQAFTILVLLSIMETLVALLIPDFKRTEVLNKFDFKTFVILILIIAPISEETFFRGLMQSFLSDPPIKGFTIYKFFISYPIIVCAIFFGFLHFGWVNSDISIGTIMLLLPFLIASGIIFGYYREKTGSVYVAIFLHMCSNMGFYCLLFFPIIEIIKKLRPQWNLFEE
jgi:membrane protease YdiL (CAAX protease family)